MKDIEVYDAIAGRFAAEWDESDAAMSLENEAVTGSKKPAGGDPRVRLSLAHHVRSQTTIAPEGEGTRTFRQYGTIFVQLFVARDKGMRPLYELGEKVRAIFQGKEIDGVRCGATNVREVGIDGQSFVGVAETAFDHDELR